VPYGNTAVLAVENNSEFTLSSIGPISQKMFPQVLPNPERIVFPERKSLAPVRLKLRLTGK
jgi:hypothetical protein